MADAFDLIRRALAGHPHVRLETMEGGLLVQAKNGGFDVSIQGVERETIVSAGLWHEYFEDAAAASDCFLWLLTPATRIVEKRRRGSPVSARLERLEGDSWVSLGTTTLMIQWFFLPVDEVVLRNRHIEQTGPEMPTEMG